MDGIILPHQNGLIGGSNMGDNIFIVAEIIHKIKTSKVKKLVWGGLKAYINKAYDKFS